jgi:hypothetical protein
MRRVRQCKTPSPNVCPGRNRARGEVRRNDSRPYIALATIPTRAPGPNPFVARMRGNRPSPDNERGTLSCYRERGTGGEGPPAARSEFASPEHTRPGTALARGCRGR